jgi:hypothetical protein
MEERLLKAYKGSEPYIFVSYSHEDRETVMDVIGWLQAGGYRVWYDGGITPARDFRDTIALSVQNCSYFIVFASNYAVSRVFVQDEINCAKDFKKPILPIFLEKTIKMPPGIQMGISGFQGIEYFKLSWDGFVEALKAALPKELIGEEKTELPPRPPSFSRRKLAKKTKKATKNVAEALLPRILEILGFLALSLLVYFLQTRYDLIGLIGKLFK